MILILTDFGLDSIYLAEMIAMIKSFNPYAEVKPIKNNIQRHNILEASFILKEIVKYYPSGTIFICVVDPTVGTERLPLVILTDKHILIGPDNGIFYPLISEQKVISIYRINTKKLPLKEISSTFHGRDVFAQVAALLSIGFKPEYFCNKIDKIQYFNIGNVIYEKDTIKGKVIYIDEFGNLVTNISKDYLQKAGFNKHKYFKLLIGMKEYKLPFIKTYAEVKKGNPLLLINSFNLLEIAINQGNAKEYFKVNVNFPVIIKRI